MRSVSLGFAILAAGYLPSAACAQRAGDKVVVKTDLALLQVNDKTTAIELKGSILDVTKVSGDRFWVRDDSSRTNEILEGWIDRSQVIPFSQSLDFFSQEVKQNPSARAYIHRGLAWQDKGDLDRAIADFNEAVRLDSSDQPAYTNRGAAWYQKGELDKAIADFDRALRLNPNFASAYVNRGGAFLSKDDYDKAIADFNEAIRLNPHLQAAYNNRGGAWLKKGNYEKAAADYNEAMRLDPNDASPHYGRGVARAAKKELDEAIADFDDAIRLDPRLAFAYRTRGDAWESKKKYDKALADYTMAIQLNSKYATAYNDRAWLQATCSDARYRNGKKAVEDAKKACDLTGWKDAAYFDTLAAATAEMGDFAGAVRWQTKALDLADKNERADMQSHLSLYRNQKAYHEEPPKK